MMIGTIFKLLGADKKLLEMFLNVRVNPAGQELLGTLPGGTMFNTSLHAGDDPVGGGGSVGLDPVPQCVDVL